MTDGSVVNEQVDEPTAHAVVAAQLRGESQAAENAPDTVVDSIAVELVQLGLDPDIGELKRRYNIGETRVPESMRQRR